MYLAQQVFDCYTDVMEFLGIGLVLSVPIFFLYGVYTFFTTVLVGRRTRIKNLLTGLREYLRYPQADHDRDTLEAAVQVLERHLTGPAPSGSQAAASSLVQPAENQATPPNQNIPPANTAAAKQRSAPPDDINVLLYVGAFLLVVAGGIFVGFSYQTFSDLTKTVLVAGVSWLFYGVGLGLFTQTKKLQPAGVTFTSIGLLLWPLVGVAAYTLVFNQTAGELIWLATSVVAVLMYVLAMKVLRQTLFVYLSLLTVISLVEALVAVVTVPVYFLGWGLQLVAMIFVVASQRQWADLETDQPLRLTSQVMVPVSLGLSWLLVPDTGYGQLAISCALAAGFYFLITRVRQFARTQTQELAQVGVVGLVATTLILAVRSGVDSFIEPEISTLMLVIAGVWIGIGWFLKTHLHSVHQTAGQTGSSLSGWSQAWAVVGALLPVASILTTFDQSTGWLLASVAASVIATLIVGVWWQWVSILAIGMILSLTLPLLIFETFLPDQPVQIRAGLYLSVLLGWLLTRARLAATQSANAFVRGARFIATDGYGLAAVASLVVAVQAGGWWVPIIFGAVAGLGIVASQIENSSWLVAGSLSLALVAVVSVTEPLKIDQAWVPLILSLASLGVYGLHRLFQSVSQAQTARAVGLIGIFIGPVLFGLDQAQEWQPMVALVLAGGLSCFESWLRQNRSWFKVSLGVLVLAVQWIWLGWFELEEAQLYALTWAGYAAVMAWDSWRQNLTDVENWVLVSLVAATVPLGIQALDDPVRGLWLLAESVVLLLLGLKFNNKLISRWGAGVMVLQVLYYLRDFIVGLPAWLIFGGLGLGLLVASVVILLRRSDDTSGK